MSNDKAAAAYHGAEPDKPKSGMNRYAQIVAAVIVTIIVALAVSLGILGVVQIWNLIVQVSA